MKLDRSTSPPITAGKLAEKLMEHPDALVQVALPDELYVLGVIYFPPGECGSPKGVHLIGVSLDGFTDET